MGAELSANATLKINLHLFTRMSKERKHEKHSLWNSIHHFWKCRNKKNWAFCNFFCFQYSLQKLFTVRSCCPWFLKHIFFCPLKWMLLWKHLKLFNCVEFIINGACTTNVSQTLLLPNSDYCLELSIYENLYCIKFNLICIPLLFFCRWWF